MIRTYDPGGKAQRVLELTLAGARPMDDFWADAGIEHKPGPRRKLFYVVIKLVEDGLLARAGAAYAITDAGVQALAQLRGGLPYQVETTERSQLGPRRSAA